MWRAKLLTAPFDGCGRLGPQGPTHTRVGPAVTVSTDPDTDALEREGLLACAFHARQPRRARRSGRCSRLRFRLSRRSQPVYRPIHLGVMADLPYMLKGGLRPPAGCARLASLAVLADPTPTGASSTEGPTAAAAGSTTTRTTGALR